MTILRQLRQKQLQLSYRIIAARKKINTYPQDLSHSSVVGYVANLQAYNYCVAFDEFTDYMSESMIVALAEVPYQIYILAVHGIVTNSMAQWSFLNCCDNTKFITSERLDDVVYDIHTALLHIYRGEWEDFEQDLIECMLKSAKAYKFDRNNPVLFRGYFYKSYPRLVATLLLNNRRRNPVSIFKQTYIGDGELELQEYKEEGICSTEKMYQLSNVRYSK